MSHSSTASRSTGHVVSTPTFNSTLSSVSSYFAARRQRSGRFSTLFLVLACCLAVVSSASAQLTLMQATQTPVTVDSGDGQAVELGVKFRSDTNGTVTGLRFYKASANTGIHVGHLWSSTGTLLGSATFSGESASGWQQVNFATPISVAANTTYVASYFAPAGHYSEN